MNLFAFKIMLLFSLTALSCAISEETELTEFNWLLGTWRVDNGATFEHWEKTNDILYSGSSYRVNGVDTTIMETIELTKKGKYIFYIPNVVNQNEGAPIPFRMIGKKDNKLIFENKAHDFPQRIEYHLQNETEIQAWIKGSEKEKGFRKIGFLLQKIN